MGHDAGLIIWGLLCHPKDPGKEEAGGSERDWKMLPAGCEDGERGRELRIRCPPEAGEAMETEPPGAPRRTRPADTSETCVGLPPSGL